MIAKKEFLYRLRDRKLCTLYFLLLGVIILAGCGGSGGDGDPGVAPTISGLSLSPQGAYIDLAGEQTTISGTFDFFDPEGDVSTVIIDVLDTSNQIVISEIIDITGADGVKSGTIQGSVTVNLEATGNYTVQIIVTDSKGNDSNQLESTFSVVEFPWVEKTPMPTSRLKFATAFYNGLIYVIGGQDASAPVTPKPPLATVEIYDPSSDTWLQGPAMLAALSGQMVATVNGKIYVIGGIDEFALDSNVVQEYDPVSQNWTMKTNMPSERSMAAIAVYNDLIYIAGGNSGPLSQSSMLRYEPTLDNWIFESPMIQSREGPAGATVNGQIFVYGGYDSVHIPDGGYIGIIEEYDPSLDIWTNRTPGMPRRDQGLAVFNGLIYAFGGNNVSRSLDWASAYDVSSDIWINKTSMPISMAFAQAETVNDKIYVFSTDTTLEYTPSNDLK